MQAIRFIRVCLLACLTAVLLQGCGIPFNAAQFDQTAEAKYLQATMDKLAAHDYGAIEAAMDTSVKQANVHQTLEEMAALLPPTPPVEKHAVSWNFSTMAHFSGTEARERTASVEVEYVYATPKWLLVSARLSGDTGHFHIIGFHIQVLPASLAETNAFRLRGKGAGDYVFMLIAILTILIALFAFISCLRIKGLKRKWLWALATLVTVMSFRLDWTSGQMDFSLTTASLLGWGVLRPGWLGPWLVVFPVPIGALVFLWKFWLVITSPNKTVASRARPVRIGGGERHGRS